MCSNVFGARLISASDADHQLVWTIVDVPWTHHHGYIELFPEGSRRTRFVWTTDLLPHALAHQSGASMERAMPVSTGRWKPPHYHESRTAQGRPHIPPHVFGLLGRNRHRLYGTHLTQ